MRALLLTAILTLHGAAAAVAQDQPTVYHGACDGSAAVMLDANHFVVANDDENALRVYKIGDPDPKATIPLNAVLKPEGDDKEVDIEGAARIGNRIYWIASHGRDKDGNKESSRRRFFATDVKQSGDPVPSVLPPTPPYSDLLKQLTKLPKLDLKEASKLAPEKKDGLNIEGLAAARDKGLLIGLRNPLPKGKAIVIPFTNPDDVLDNKKKPKFGDPERLDLGGRGIRSIEWIGGRYVIVAGPFGDGDNDFALYSWSGASGVEPKRLTGFVTGDVKAELLFNFKPEALFATDPTTNPKAIYLLSDDGTDACKGEKDQNRKTFRGLAVRLTD